jgi:tripartite ATP-independent transporter DctP family solute receptor
VDHAGAARLLSLQWLNKDRKQKREDEMNPGRDGARRRAMTRRSVLQAAAALPAFLAGAPAVAQGRAKRIRYAHSTPVTHGWHLWGERFKKVVEEKTGGKIQVTIFPNAQMGNEQDIAKAVRLGSIEMASVGVALMNWVPDISVTDAPFLFRSRKQAYAALDGALGSELKKRSLAQGFRIVGWNDLGFRCMTNNKHPINSVNDMRDLKMRVPDSRSYNAMMQATGASVIAVDLSELYLALSQGVADGQDTPPSVVKSNKFYEVQKFVSKTDHILTNAYSIINASMFDNYAKDEQDAVLASASDATEWLRQYTQKDEAEAYDFLKGKGMQVNLAVDTASFREACSSVIAKFPDLFPPDLVKLAQSAEG